MTWGWFRSGSAEVHHEPKALPAPALPVNVHQRGDQVSVAVRSDGQIQLIASPETGFGTTITFSQATAHFLISALQTVVRALPDAQATLNESGDT